MAKKKASSRNSNGASNEQQQSHSQAAASYQKPAAAELSRQFSMEDHDSSEEKFQNLKSLNAILLKQAVEKRQQIETLSHAKESLEAELTRSGAERTRLREELLSSGDESFVVRLEMDLFVGIVESRLREIVDGLVREKSECECEVRGLRREVGELEKERDELARGDLIKSEEVNRLKESVVRLEMKETVLGEEVVSLKSENGRMVKERGEREELIERVSKERKALEKRLEVKVREIDELKREMKGLFMEKKEVEMVNCDQKEKIVKLEKKVENLTREEKGLRDQVIGLEKSLDEVKEEAKAREESVIASEKEKLAEQYALEKVDLLEHISKREAEFDEMNKVADEQKHVVVQLRNDYNDQIKASEKLSCDVSQLKDALALVEVERDNAGKALDEEKKSRVALKEKVAELEKTIQASGKELEKIKAERGRLIKEKKELENRSEALRKEKGVLQKDLVELKKAMGVLKTELESAGTNAKRGLTMLKTVSSLVCGQDNKKGEQKRGEKGVDSYSVEVEAIKKAFKNKESMVEEMKKEIETMKHSVKDAHDKKSFWTLVSSITTLFMAASVAYAAAIK
ncbi:myosin-11 [Brassica napus]|uniref:myosin-11 n=1 Tax=Brassica napus TaxID=3708 RepID=UPI0020787998|nr:myosin-11 [Brassica napus]